MGLPLYLAGTADEIRAWGDRRHAAFLACHFSLYGHGLELPGELPRCGMVILTDRVPVWNHRPERVAGQLGELLERAGADSLLLDLQRPPEPRAIEIAEAAAALPCPVAVTEGYAHIIGGPVLVEVPMGRPLTDRVSQWPGRELWLDVAGNTQRITVTREGPVFTAIPPVVPAGICHREERLHCSYRVEAFEDRAEFTLFRTREDIAALLKEAESLGFTRAVGLYQELHAL